MKSPNPSKHNIIIFGESGSGKSSIVNMLVGQEVAPESNPFDSTLKSAAYDVDIGGSTYCLHDTTGLNETEQSRLPDVDTIANLYTLIRKLDGVSLLIYCHRGTIRENTRANWVLFNNAICLGRVPIVVVVTGVENEEPAGWAEQVECMKESFGRLEMKPQDLAFLVPIRGKLGEFEDLYEESNKKLSRVIENFSLRPPWNMEKDRFFQTLYEVYITRFCPIVHTEVESNEGMADVIDEFVKKTNMADQDATNFHQTCSTWRRDEGRRNRC